ncbi:MAG: alcohol dehydrogenase catalytic domain-containing protein [Firmicutes bacterium]|nr:alcohol dehydrogenase catalytic domain-containing protein [Bacillota bacterium]
MRAWKVISHEEIVLEEMKPKALSEGQVKVKLNYSLITHSDILAFESNIQPEPKIIGRLGVGMVSETHESVTNFVRGDRVLVSPYFVCKECFECENDNEHLCSNLKILSENTDGVLSDFVNITERQLIKLPENVSDNDAVFIEYVAHALNIFSKLKVQKGEHVVIVGANCEGMLCAHLALYYQAVPILIDTRADRLQKASEDGVYYAINSAEDDISSKILKATGGRMAEKAIITSYHDAHFLRVLKFVQKNARCVFGMLGKNEAAIDVSVPLKNFNVIIEKSLSVYGVPDGFRHLVSAINLLANKSVKIKNLITKEVGFSEVDKVIAELKKTQDRFVGAIVKF